jgi:hypothetical protein
VSIPLVEVGRADSAHDAGYPYRLESVGDRVVLSTGITSRLPLLFESDGRFVREIGRRGSGPGELTLPGLVLVDGDRLLIQDLVTRQLQILSGRRLSRRGTARYRDPATVGAGNSLGR